MAPNTEPEPQARDGHVPATDPPYVRAGDPPPPADLLAAFVGEVRFEPAEKDVPLHRIIGAGQQPAGTFWTATPVSLDEFRAGLSVLNAWNGGGGDIAYRPSATFRAWRGRAAPQEATRSTRDRPSYLPGGAEQIAIELFASPEHAVVQRPPSTSAVDDIGWLIEGGTQLCIIAEQTGGLTDTDRGVLRGRNSAAATAGDVDWTIYHMYCAITRAASAARHLGVDLGIDGRAVYTSVWDTAVDLRARIVAGDADDELQEGLRGWQQRRGVDVEPRRADRPPLRPATA